MVAHYNLIARPYAKAAFDYASQHHALGQWSQSLAILAQCVDNKRINSALRAPEKIPEASCQILFDLTKGQLCQAMEHFVRLLAKNKRLLILPQINVLFDQLLKISQNTSRIDVITTFELNKTQKDALQAQLKRYFSETIQIYYRVDQQILGGVIIKAGDKVIDASFTGQLKQLTTTLLAPKTSE